MYDRDELPDNKAEYNKFLSKEGMDSADGEKADDEDFRMEASYGIDDDDQVPAKEVFLKIAALSINNDNQVQEKEDYNGLPLKTPCPSDDDDQVPAKEVFLKKAALCMLDVSTICKDSFKRHNLCKAKSSLRMLHVFTVIGVAICMNTPTIELQTRPMIIGKEVSLSCTFDNPDDTAISLVWLKGVAKKQVANGLKTANKTKYTSDVHHNNGSIDGNLIIQTFSTDDIDGYICQVNVFESQMLKLNEDETCYIPDAVEILAHTELSYDELDVIVNLQQVYPKPTCEALFQNANFTISINMTANNAYVLRLTIRTIEARCNGLLNITCTVLKTSFPVFLDEVNYCPNTQHPAMTGYILACILIIGVLVVLLYALYVYVQMKEKRRHTSYEFVQS